jgi:benzoylformate decarboxylase
LAVGERPVSVHQDETGLEVRRGADLLLDILVDEGITRVFGNPGTTELPLVAALSRRTDIRYVLALHEGTVVAMADGYAQVTGQPAFLNLHTTSGLGNAMGQLVNAKANHTPLVVTAGQQDRRHLVREPMLSGDLVGMVRATTKWAQEVTSLAELPTLLRRAIHDAAASPAGPVFLSLPLDILEEVGEAFDPGRSTLDRRSEGGSLPELASLLTEVSPDGLAMVLDDEVASGHAVEAAVALAEALGADVYGAPLHGRSVFPPAHPLWRGMLAPTSSAVSKTLGQYRRVLFVGGQAFLTLHYTPEPLLPPDVELLHISPIVEQLARLNATRLGVLGDLARTMKTLLTMVAPNVDAPAVARRISLAGTERKATSEKYDVAARSRYEQLPMHAMAVAHATLGAVPPDAYVVDEAITTSPYVRGFHDTTKDRYFSCRGGGLGWAMPAAVGISLATGAEPVLCIVGDGATLYAPQALWTATREELPVVFAVVNNRQYSILRRYVRASGAKIDVDALGDILNLDNPPVDYLALANSFGMTAMRASSAEEIDDQVRQAWSRSGPTLIEMTIATDA